MNIPDTGRVVVDVSTVKRKIKLLLFLTSKEQCTTNRKTNVKYHSFFHFQGMFQTPDQDIHKIKIIHFDENIGGQPYAPIIMTLNKNTRLSCPNHII